LVFYSDGCGRRKEMAIFGRKHDEFPQVYEEIEKLRSRVIRVESNLRALRTQRMRRQEHRVGVFVDVQNMFYAAKKQFEARLDYVKLLQHVLKGRRLVTAIAYVVENPEIDQSSFFSLLSHHSFTIRKKALIQRADGSQKGDCDMEIAMDILNLAESLDVVALISGDGDFVSLLHTVKTRGPTIEVHAFPQNTALDLKEVADEFFPIGESLLFRQ
jgi:uncharacterized LabA/DUF88 family protein